MTFAKYVSRAAVLALLASVPGSFAATAPPLPTPLDPSRGLESYTLEKDVHKPLPEQYIWTAKDAYAITHSRLDYHLPSVSSYIAPHYFRAKFTLENAPKSATLYIAGPREVTVYLNGKLADKVSSDLSSPLGLHVFETDVAKFLQPGNNVLAIQAVRGRGIPGYANSAQVLQQTMGEVLVAKILAAPRGEQGPALVISDGSWRSTTRAPEGWQNAGFDDAGWEPVQSLGSIEGSVDFLQWNADAGMYAWPGYDGISPFLAHTPLAPVKISQVFTGRGSIDNLDSLKQLSAAKPFTVHLSASRFFDQNAPGLLLDFGREITGRLALASDSGASAIVSVRYGESKAEVEKDPYLGTNLVQAPAHATAYGPKSAFRYVKIRFLSGPPELSFRSIYVDHIFYPVKYEGSFESSDPLLNKIWTVGAYTAHLCMQDDIWDAPKRDRGRWMGDLDVSGRVIEDVFADRFLMEDTLNRLIGPAPVEQDVNGIPGYSAFWFTGVAEYYRHTGDKKFLESLHDRMVQLLGYMDSELAVNNLFGNMHKAWLFVDWSHELHGDTAETRSATLFEFYYAYRQGAYLLRQLGDTANADKFESRAADIKAAANQYLLDKSTDTYGLRWQTNAMAVLSGIAPAEQYPAIWRHVLSNVGHVKYNPFPITPYYNYYVISAMAKMDRRQAALDWIREYWGGMLDEGATSFWEGYDLSWHKSDFHASLQADAGSGYYVSLAHGWSSGPTAWLMEQMLGIESTGPGFSHVNIRPDLMNVAWAKGAEPTPHGPIRVEARAQKGRWIATIDLPPGVDAHISVPAGRTNVVVVNGAERSTVSEEKGERRAFDLNAAGHYAIRSR